MEVINNINQLLGDDLLQNLHSGTKLSIAASCFSIYAYEVLMKELQERDDA